MKSQAILALLSAFAWLSLLSPLAEGHTWRVEKDGSGDYTTIQPAVDGAAPGDSIMIGPGRYSETTLYNPDAAKDFFPKPVMIAVTVDDLTILGAGTDQVYLSPETPDSG